MQSNIIDKKLAEQFVKTNDPLLLENAITMSLEAATMLSKCEHKLDLFITTATDEIITILAKHRRTLSFHNLAKITDAGFEQLTMRHLEGNVDGHEPQTYLNQIKKINFNNAESIANNIKYGVFSISCRSLSSECIDSIIKIKPERKKHHTETLLLDHINIKKINKEDALKLLSNSSSISIGKFKSPRPISELQNIGGLPLSMCQYPLGELSPLHIDIQYAYKWLMGPHLYSFNNAISIDDDAMEVIASGLERYDSFSMNSLVHLSDKCAEYLSTVRCNEIAFDSIEVITEKAAECLALTPSALSFKSIKNISDGVAKALSRHRGVLSLVSVESLTDESVKHLVQHKSKIWLNSLKEVSEESLNLLKNHGNIFCQFLNLNSFD